MKAENNKYPHVTVTPGAAPATPDSGDVRLFVDVADGLLKIEDDAAAVTTVGSGTPFSGDAVDVAIADAGTLYTATNVEDALAEVMGAVAGGGLTDPPTVTYIDGTGAAAPGNPASGDARMYAKTDGRWYSRDNAGVEYGPFDAAGGGGGSGLYAIDETFPGSSLPAGWTFTGGGSCVVSGSKARVNGGQSDRLMYAYTPGRDTFVLRAHWKAITGAVGMPSLVALDSAGKGIGCGPYNDGSTYAWTVNGGSSYQYSGTNAQISASQDLTDSWLMLMVVDGKIVGAGWGTDGIAWTGINVNAVTSFTFTQVGICNLLGTSQWDLWELTITEP